MLKLAGLENLAETELGRITTKTQQEEYIQQIMAPGLKNFLDKIPALRLLILLEWTNVKFRTPLACDFHIPLQAETTVYMALVRHVPSGLVLSSFIAYLLQL